MPMMSLTFSQFCETAVTLPLFRWDIEAQEFELYPVGSREPWKGIELSFGDMTLAIWVEDGPEESGKRWRL